MCSACLLFAGGALHGTLLSVWQRACMLEVMQTKKETNYKKTIKHKKGVVF
jgi:hypothetical protein